MADLLLLSVDGCHKPVPYFISVLVSGGLVVLFGLPDVASVMSHWCVVPVQIFIPVHGSDLWSAFVLLRSISYEMRSFTVYHVHGIVEWHSKEDVNAMNIVLRASDEYWFVYDSCYQIFSFWIGNLDPWWLIILIHFAPGISMTFCVVTLSVLQLMRVTLTVLYRKCGKLPA